MKKSLWIVSILTLLAATVDAGQWEPVEIALERAPVVDVLHHLGELAGAELEMGSSVDGSISLELQRVSLLTALDAVCESAGCTWSLVGGAPRRLQVEPGGLPTTDDPLDRRVSFSLRKADGMETLNTFGRLINSEVVFENPIDGRVTMTLEKVTARTLLAAVCEQLACRIELQEGPPRRLVLRSAEAAQEPPKDVRGLLSKPINLELAGVAAAPMFGAFARILGVQLRLSREIGGKASMAIEQQPIEAALTEACGHFDCSWSLVSVDGSLTLDIQPAPN